MKHLTQDEIKALLREVPNPRQRLMFKMGFLHGLRISELLNLIREDVRDGYVDVQRLKGSLHTIQPYVKHPDPELNEADELRELFGTLKSGERLFPWTRNGAYKMMQKAGKNAGIFWRKCHPHALKHSCAMISIKKLGIDDVRQYLGHRSMSSTGAYLEKSDEEASRAFAESLTS
jgi:integrase